MSAVRVRSVFVPAWEGTIEGWVVNYITDNKWRTKPAFGFDDLYQEAFLCFAICCERYPQVVEAPHFMSLFKRTFMNRVHDMASRRTREKAFSYDENSELGPPTSDSLLGRQQKMCPEMMGAELDMLVQDAPGPIRELIATVLEAPDELLGFLRAETTGLRENAVKRLARLARVATWRGAADDLEGCEADLARELEAWAGVAPR